jgi:hypothetical protein
MALYSVQYFYNTVDEVHAEITEVCLLGKPPYALRCTKCGAKNIPCVLYAIVNVFGSTQKSIYCDQCCCLDIAKRRVSGDPDDNGPR